MAATELFVFVWFPITVGFWLNVLIVVCNFKEAEMMRCRNEADELKKDMETAQQQCLQLVTIANIFLNNLF